MGLVAGDTAGMPERRGPGALESEVLGALWSGDEPLTSAQVQAQIGGEIAYNTIQTILTRLLDKGLVLREKTGRAHTYRPVSGQAEFAAEQMRAMLAHGPDHAAVLQSFVDGLTADDEVALRRLLDAGAPPTTKRRGRRGTGR